MKLMKDSSLVISALLGATLRERLGVNNADCVVFTKVLEHLHYYYVISVLGKIGNALKGLPYTHDTNIASLFRGLRLLLGR